MGMIPGLYGKTVFNFVRGRQTILHRGCMEQWIFLLFLCCPCLQSTGRHAGVGPSVSVFVATALRVLMERLLQSAGRKEYRGA